MSKISQSYHDKTPLFKGPKPIAGEKTAYIALYRQFCVIYLSLK